MSENYLKMQISQKKVSLMEDQKPRQENLQSCSLLEYVEGPVDGTVMKHSVSARHVVEKH